MIRRSMTMLFSLTVLFSVVCCTSLTPRYEMYPDNHQFEETTAAVFQIPKHIYVHQFDHKEPSFGVKSSFKSQIATPHPYRESLISPGLHTCQFRNEEVRRREISKTKYKTEIESKYMKGTFISAFEAKKGNTYRVMSLRKGEIYYGWVEEFIGIVERLELSTVITTKHYAKTREWATRDWRIVAAGLNADQAKFLSDNEILTIAKKNIDEVIDTLPQYIRK